MALRPKGAGFLWARPEHQVWIEPLVVSWGYGAGATFAERHGWQGTRDPAAALAVPAAIEYWPGALCLESKSLKLYLARYRNEGAFCEALAVGIRDDVAEALGLPADKVRVALTQKARGGITITATT